MPGKQPSYRAPWLIRILECIAAPLSLTTLYKLATVVGTLGFMLSARQRKRILGNLSLAGDLNLDRHTQQQIARKSLINLYAVTFDYLKLRNLDRDSNHIISNIVSIDNPEVIDQLIADGHSPIIVTGHLANWEATFLGASSQQPGIVISQRFFVEPVADWIHAIRTQFGGELTPPQHAVRVGMRALRQGRFAGLAIDQALPEGGLPLTFFGTRAYTTPTPALWALRTDSPIVMVMARRSATGYRLRYHTPIWPNTSNPHSDEIQRLTQQLQRQLEADIRRMPGDYLWLHNRYQQHTHQHLQQAYRHDVLMLVLPESKQAADEVIAELSALNRFYPRALLTIYIPSTTSKKPTGLSTDMQVTVKNYETLSDTLEDDWRYQLILDYSQGLTVSRYYRRRGAFASIKLSSSMPLEQQLTDQVLIHHS
ncbi:Lipid A biosynthesis lauroyltransferase [BD1-7 clade bacterium]|uniref:Lipid A biosynthesis lauroyltransferase n=1 Tax=BD1-7 clade bacterium TaxID=2029982 RepID=A0A5S9NVR0_9GAMM|nr:Lipid A biosynthesis lauroyltransferase [BD1-7 clade bacterium]CAA0095512.1 Lipid A biosynthesis lauroyltransferase [BD1-7 clade bacterium]